MIHLQVIVLVLVVSALVHWLLLLIPAAVSAIVLYRLDLVVGRDPLLLLLLGPPLPRVIVTIIVRVIDYILEKFGPHLLLVLANLGAVLDEVLLVADEGDLNMLVRVFADLFEPFLQVVE